MNRKIPGLRLVIGILIVVPLLALVHERRGVPTKDASGFDPVPLISETQKPGTTLTGTAIVPTDLPAESPTPSIHAPEFTALDFNFALLSNRLQRVAPGPMHTCGLNADLTNRVACLARILEGKSTAAKKAEPPKFIPPVYGIITSGYGYRKTPIGEKVGTETMHEGVDLAAPKNSLFVAPADGTVVAVEYRRGYGALLTISHKAGFETRYAHVGSIFVKEGQAVRSGQPLGVIGLTGRTTGPHIHFEMRRNGHLIDPAPFLDLPTDIQIARLANGDYLSVQ